MPTTTVQGDVWQQYNEWYDVIEERYDGGISDLKVNERNKQRKNLEGKLRTLLVESGYGDQVTWMDLWPLQKLNEAGSLPSLLQDSDFVGMVNGIQQRRAADGFKSVGDDDSGRRALTRLLMIDVRDNPLFREELVELGIQLYGELLPEAIIPILFFNDRF